MNGYNKTNLKTFRTWLTANQSNRKLAVMGTFKGSKLHALTVGLLQLTTNYFYVNVAYAYSLNLWYNKVKSIECRLVSDNEIIYVLAMTHDRKIYLSNNVYNLY